MGYDCGLDAKATCKNTVYYPRDSADMPAFAMFNRE